MTAARDKLALALQAKARALDLSDSQMCKIIGIEQAYFSRWKNGEHLAPDLRKESNKKVYKCIAEFLDIYLFEVVELVMFEGNGQGIHEGILDINPELLARIEKIDKTLIKSPLARSLERKICAVKANAIEHEESLDLAIDCMKSYVEKIKRVRWKEK